VKAEVDAMAKLDFQHWRIKHRAWRTKLKSFLEGEETLTREQATSHKDCGLGKWLYGGGLEQYRHISEMKALEKVHITLHDTVRNIITLKDAGKDAEAKTEYAKIAAISDEVIALLTKVEEKAKSEL
jgi:methyl-accepting chemotaxis protein